MAVAQVGQDPAKAFSTHANYVHAFAALSGYTATRHWDRGLSGLTRHVDDFLGQEPVAVRRGVAPDLAQVEKSLRAAWGTELIMIQQMLLVEDVAELCRVASAWIAVQAYYTGYHAAQGMIVAEGKPRPRVHPKTQAGFVTSWAGRAGVIHPWSMTHSHHGLRNCTEPVDLEVSNLSRCTSTNCTSLAAKALKTTWDHFVDDKVAAARIDKYKREKKQHDEQNSERAAAGKKALAVPRWYGKDVRNLTSAERSALEASAPEAGLLHYLFRLRIKANYVDADMFVDGPSSNFDGQTFIKHLTYLASSIVTVHEQRVRHAVGIEPVRAMQERWNSGAGAFLPNAGTGANYRIL